MTWDGNVRYWAEGIRLLFAPTAGSRLSDGSDRLDGLKRREVVGFGLAALGVQQVAIGPYILVTGGDHKSPSRW